jgi:release factor glutamine methyltransferase
MTNIRTILQRAARDLNVSGSLSPRLDAELLLMHLLKIDRLHLCTHPERELTEEEAAAFVQRVARRSLGEPVAYILEEKEFWSLRFEVGREVLIPRPETECLIEEVLRIYRPPGEGLRVLDIGTGSGAIGVVLTRELPAARVAATDISSGALAVTRRNAQIHGVADRMEFFQGDLFTAVSGDWDIICSNPPYIPEVEYNLLPAGIRNFEPPEALIAGPDGLDFHRKIIREGAHRLKEEGRIFLEIGEG